MAKDISEGCIVRFMHHWATEELKPRPGLVVNVDSERQAVVVAPGLSTKPKWSEPIEFPKDFGGGPAGKEGIGLEHTTHLDLADLAWLPFSKVTLIGKIPVPITVLERVKTRIYEFNRLGRIEAPKKLRPVAEEHQ